VRYVLLRLPQGSGFAELWFEIHRRPYAWISIAATAALQFVLGVTKWLSSLVRCAVCKSMCRHLNSARVGRSFIFASAAFCLCCFMASKAGQLPMMAARGMGQNIGVE